MNVLICAYDIENTDKRNELTKRLTEDQKGQQLSESCYIFSSSDHDAESFYNVVRPLAQGANDRLWVGKLSPGTLKGHAGTVPLTMQVTVIAARALSS